MTTTITDLEREQVLAALNAIVASHHGVLNQQAVLDAARDPSHVLHPFFDWDDARAGEAYRLLQVNALVRRVRLTVVRQDHTTRAVTITTTRGYQSRPSMRHRDGGYEPVESILSDDEKRRELLAQVLRELASYRKRYADLQELESVWAAVDDVTTDLLSPPSVAPPTDGESRHGAAG